MKNFMPLLTATLLHLCFIAQAQPAGPATQQKDSLALKTIQKNEARKNMMAQARMDAWESLRNSGQLNRPDTPVNDNPSKPESQAAGHKINAASRSVAASKPAAVKKQAVVKKKTVAHKPVSKKPVAKNPVAKKPVALSKTAKKKTVSPQKITRKPTGKPAAKSSKHPATHKPVAPKKKITHAPKKAVSGKFKPKPVPAPKKPVKKHAS